MHCIAISALIHVPDIGIFEYLGRAMKSAEARIISALDGAHLTETERIHPYESGVNMHAASPNSVRHRDDTFGVIDSLTDQGEMNLIEQFGEGPEESVYGELSRLNPSKAVFIVHALSAYSGVYIEDYSVNDLMVVPDRARELLEN